MPAETPAPTQAEANRLATLARIDRLLNENRLTRAVLIAALARVRAERPQTRETRSQIAYIDDEIEDSHLIAGGLMHHRSQFSTREERAARGAALDRQLWGNE